MMRTMAAPKSPYYDHAGDYIAGRFENGKADETLVRVAPGDLDFVTCRAAICHAHVDSAVAAAAEARKMWRHTPREERERLLRRYQKRVRDNADRFAECIAMETGKPLWDARTEAGALASKVEFMLGAGAEATADRELESLGAALRFRPHGVMAVIGPFNFPVHLPNGQIVPALLHGNTVVFKPSEKTPSAPQLMAECFDQAGFPPGVFNMVQGGVETSKRLLAHADIDGILFTGSIRWGSRYCAKM